MVQKVPLDVLLECLPEQNGLHEVVLSCGNMLLALEEKDVGSIGLVVVQKVSDLLVGVELGDFGVVVADPVGGLERWLSRVRRLAAPRPLAYQAGRQRQRILCCKARCASCAVGVDSHGRICSVAADDRADVFAEWLALDIRRQ